MRSETVIKDGEKERYKNIKKQERKRDGQKAKNNVDQQEGNKGEKTERRHATKNKGSKKWGERSKVTKKALL
jgi:hypothetical protein